MNKETWFEFMDRAKKNGNSPANQEIFDRTSMSVGREILDKELKPIKNFVRNTFLCSSKKKRGRFLCWTWELWSIGGGSGVEWFRFRRNINSPGRFNPLWIIFRWQSGEK